MFWRPFRALSLIASVTGVAPPPVFWRPFRALFLIASVTGACTPACNLAPFQGFVSHRISNGGLHPRLCSAAISWLLLADSNNGNILTDIPSLSALSGDDSCVVSQRPTRCLSTPHAALTISPRDDSQHFTRKWAILCAWIIDAASWVCIFFAGRTAKPLPKRPVSEENVF